MDTTPAEHHLFCDGYGSTKTILVYRDALADSLLAAFDFNTLTRHMARLSRGFVTSKPPAKKLLPACSL